MQKRHVVFVLIACTIISCGNDRSKEEKPIEKAAVALPVYKMDMLEKIFNNDNWMKKEGRDTSYYYFSRVPSEIQVHQYRIVKGDSVITTISSIKFSNDSLVWRYNDSTDLFLAGITNETAEWSRINNNTPASFYLAFEKKDEKHINLVNADKKQFVLTRTIPLSTFLIRSSYDHLNGTTYAFSDTIFSTGKKK